MKRPLAKPFLTESALNILNRFINCPVKVQPPRHQITKKRYEFLKDIRKPKIHTACNIIISGQAVSNMVSAMDNIYYISEDDPNLRVDEIGMVGDDYDPIGMDDSLLLDLDDSDGKMRVEHRHHKRFPLNKDAYALIRSIAAEPLKIEGQSMGCIACMVFNAKPAKLGIIDNISMGGLMFQHVDNKIELTDEFVLDILLADCGFYLADIPFKVITDSVIPDDIPGDPIEMRQVQLLFQKLNTNQQARLKEFIFNHGTEMDEISNKV